MRLHLSITPYALLLAGLGLLPASVLAVSDDFIALLDNIVERQPEQQILQGIEAQHNANRRYANSLIAGDIELVLHHENDRLTGNEEATNWQLGVEFPIWLASQKSSQKQLSQGYSQELGARQHYLKWRASDLLRRLVWRYHSAQIEVDAALSALQKGRQLAQKVKLKVATGESARLDLLLAQKAVLKLQNQLVQKQSQLAIAQHQYSQWTQTTRLPSHFNERPQPPQPLAQHPEIARLMSTLQIAQAQTRQLASFKQESPRLFLGAQSDSSMGSENASLIVELSVPLGINPAFSPKLAQQKRTVLEQQALLGQAKIKLEQDIFKARQRLASSKQAINFSRHQYELSQQALTMSEQAYQLGESNIQNLLLVQQQTAQAKLDYQLAQARSGQAIAQLNQVSGHILGEHQ